MSRLIQYWRAATTPQNAPAPAEHPQHPAHVLDRLQQLGGHQDHPGDHDELEQPAVRARRLRHRQRAAVDQHVGEKGGQPEQAERSAHRIRVPQRVVEPHQGRSNEGDEGEHADQGGGIAGRAERLEHRVRGNHQQRQREQLQ